MKQTLTTVLLTVVLLPAIATAADYGAAIEVQRRRIEEMPSAAAWNDLGGLLLLAGDREQAAGAFSTALEFQPENPEALYNLGVLLLDSDPNRARKLLRSALEENEDGWTHYRLGQAFERLRRDRRAIRHFARSFELDRSLLDPKINPEIVSNRLTMKSLLRSENPHEGIRPSPRFVDTVAMRELLLPVEQEEQVEGEAGED